MMPEATLILRTLILILALGGLGLLAANLLQNIDSFNPAYKGHFFKQQCLRPAIALVLATLLWLLETPLVNWLTA